MIRSKFAGEAREAYSCNLKRFYATSACNCGCHIRKVSLIGGSVYSKCVDCIKRASDRAALS